MIILISQQICFIYLCWLILLAAPALKPVLTFYKLIFGIIIIIGQKKALVPPKNFSPLLCCHACLIFSIFDTGIFFYLKIIFFFLSFFSPHFIIYQISNTFFLKKTMRIYRVLSQELDLQHGDFKGYFIAGFEKN